MSGRSPAHPSGPPPQPSPSAVGRGGRVYGHAHEQQGVCVCVCTCVCVAVGGGGQPIPRVHIGTHRRRQTRCVCVCVCVRARVRTCVRSTDTGVSAPRSCGSSFASSPPRSCGSSFDASPPAAPSISESPPATIPAHVFNPRHPPARAAGQRIHLPVTEKIVRSLTPAEKIETSCPARVSLSLAAGQRIHLPTLEPEERDFFIAFRRLCRSRPYAATVNVRTCRSLATAARSPLPVARLCRSPPGAFP